MVIVDFWRNQNNQKGLTPANGFSPNFISLQKVLSDSNNTIYIVPLDSIKDENIRLDDISRFKVAKNGSAFSNYIQNYFCKHVFRKIPM